MRDFISMEYDGKDFYFPQYLRELQVVDLVKLKGIQQSDGLSISFINALQKTSISMAGTTLSKFPQLVAFLPCFLIDVIGSKYVHKTPYISL